MTDHKLQISLSDARRAALMTVDTDAPVSLVIDCDAGNEIDDQFAIAWTLLRQDRLDLQAIYAAPYTNSFFENQDGEPTRVEHAAEGMKRSYDEILRVLTLMDARDTVPVLKGSEHYLKDMREVKISPAVKDLIDRARNTENTLHVVTIGAPTNVACALLIAPDIAEKIHVLWLGGHSQDWYDTEEFNLMQDMPASRVLLDSGVALTLFPCMGVTNALATSIPEMQFYLLNTSRIGDYLANLAPTFNWITFASRKVMWDIANIGYLLDPSWFRSTLESSPVLNDNLTWSRDDRRHNIRIIRYIERDNLFKDIFRRIMDADKK